MTRGDWGHILNETGPQPVLRTSCASSIFIRALQIVRNTIYSQTKSERQNLSPYNSPDMLIYSSKRSFNTPFR